MRDSKVGNAATTMHHNTATMQVKMTLRQNPRGDHGGSVYILSSSRKISERLQEAFAYALKKHQGLRLAKPWHLESPRGLLLCDEAHLVQQAVSPDTKLLGSTCVDGWSIVVFYYVRSEWRVTASTLLRVDRQQYQSMSASTYTYQYYLYTTDTPYEHHQSSGVPRRITMPAERRVPDF